MADRTEVYDRIRATILRLAPVWSERMGIAHIDITHVFLESEFGDGESHDEFRIVADAWSRWNYLHSKIRWYLPSAARLSETELEETLVHELCHVLLAPEQALLEIKLEAVRADATGEELDQVTTMMFERMELATEMVARAILRAWER